MTGREAEESLRGRISGRLLFFCRRLASRVSIFMAVAAAGGANDGLGARERDRGGEILLGDADLLSCML